MQLIKSDIAIIAEYFGDDNSLWLEGIIWSRGATLALKGDVYLWSGKVLEAETEILQKPEPRWRLLPDSSWSLLTSCGVRVMR
jgi:hypothetical protein